MNSYAARHVTYGAKVLAQNTCSFFSSWESKAISNTQNFSLFPNMGWEILCQFLLWNNEGIFERPRKIVWTERVNRINVYSFLAYFTTVKNYGSWSESYAVSEYRLINCVSVFLREGLTTLSKFIWQVNKQAFYQLL